MPVKGGRCPCHLINSKPVGAPSFGAMGVPTTAPEDGARCRYGSSWSAWRINQSFLKEVPADMCENCGEYYLSEDIGERVLAIAKKAIENNVVIEILRFAA